MAEAALKPASLKPAQLKNEMAIEMIGMNKWYGEFHVLRDINLTVREASASWFAGLRVPASRP